MRFLVAVILAAILAAGCGSEVERREILMGTVVSLKAAGAESKAAVDESFARIFELEKNIAADTKKIEAAAGSGDFVELSADTYEILAISQDFAEKTGGAFDVTIGAAVDLWSAGEIPDAEQIAAVKNLVGYEKLELGANRTARLKISGMKINLGGVAKGYGVDLVREIFAAHKIDDGLIDFGTSTIFAVGAKKIGLKNPRGDGLASVVDVRDGAISTSGDYEKFIVAGGRNFCHILDPKTCAPVENGTAAVSVIVDGGVKNCGAAADILSTAAFVGGAEAISNVGFPEAVQVTIFVDGDGGVAFGHQKDGLGLIGGRQIAMLPAIFRLQINPLNPMRLGHGVRDGADLHADFVAFDLDNGHVLFGSGVGRIGRQNLHGRAVAGNFSAGLVEQHDERLVLAD